MEAAVEPGASAGDVAPKCFACERVSGLICADMEPESTPELLAPGISTWGGHWAGEPVPFCAPEDSLGGSQQVWGPKGS